MRDECLMGDSRFPPRETVFTTSSARKIAVCAGRVTRADSPEYRAKLHCSFRGECRAYPISRALFQIWPGCQAISLGKIQRRHKHLLSSPPLLEDRAREILFIGEIPRDAAIAKYRFQDIVSLGIGRADPGIPVGCNIGKISMGSPETFCSQPLLAVHSRKCQFVEERETFRFSQGDATYLPPRSEDSFITASGTLKSILKQWQ